MLFVRGASRFSRFHGRRILGDDLRCLSHHRHSDTSTHSPLVHSSTTVLLVFLVDEIIRLPRNGESWLAQLTNHKSIAEFMGCEFISEIYAIHLDLMTTELLKIHKIVNFLSFVSTSFRTSNESCVFHSF